jgi:phosphoribosylanthranilate isomerase
MWIKVCGIRDRFTASRVAELDVDAIGLNFYHGSSRVVAIEEAIEISRLLPSHIDRVGVFVNHAIDDVESIANRCGLGIVQIHGDESASYLVELRRRMPQVRLIRAWRMGNDGLEGLASFLAECHNSDCPLAGCLVDAHAPGVYGGSGKTVAWEQLVREYDRVHWPPLILAGGLTATNICAAIEATHPWGVDVASGVESSPGIKDVNLVRQFLTNARGGAEQSSQS